MDLQRRHRYSRFMLGILALALFAAPGAAGALTVGATLPSLPAGPTGPVAAPTAPKLPAPVVPVKPPTVTVPKVVTPPPVKAPVVKAPTVKTPTVKAPSVTAPSVTPPRIPSPSAGGGGSVSLPSVRQPIIGGGTSGGLIGGGSSGGSIVGGLIGGGGGPIAGGGGSIIGGTPGGPLGGGTLGGPGSGSGAGLLGGGSSGAAGAGGYGSPPASGGQFNPLVALLVAESSAGAGVGSREFAALQAAVFQLQRCMGALAPLEQQVLVTRFGLGGPPRSVGGVSRALGISRAGVIRVERRALIALRKLAQSGCGGAAGATGSLAYVLDPTTVGGLVSAASPGTGRSIFGGPARAAALTPPLWGSNAADSLRSLLLVLALAGVLLLLAGTALKMQERYAEREAPVRASYAREPRARPGIPLSAPARRRTAERRFERSNGRVTARRPGDRTRTH